MIRLYQDGRLVHGDLSEFNILVVPRHFVDPPALSAAGSDEELHVVLIDFGQAVDRNHPSSMFYLERDLERVLSFFVRQGVDAMSKLEALAMILGEGDGCEGDGKPV